MLGGQAPKIYRQQKTYLYIKDGAIVKNTPKGEEHYSYLEGRLLAIEQKGRQIKGQTLMYWYIDLKDEEGKVYSISFPFRSNVFKSIILSLASATDFSRITIKTYNMNGYDKAICYQGDQKLDWVVRKLPPVEDVEIGGRIIKDDSERLALVGRLVERIIGKLINK